MEKNTKELRILEEYSGDLYALFIKRITQFQTDPKADNFESDSVRLLAMLQEIIKVKKLILGFDNK